MATATLRQRNNPRRDFNPLDKKARAAAREAGLVARKSRRALGSATNHGGFCLLEPGGAIVAGQHFRLTPGDVMSICAR